MTLSDIGKFFDNYNRVARLYPAIIAFAPALWTSAAFGFIPDLRSGAIALLLACGFLYFLASWARSRGKQLEEKLIKRWGAWPTTMFLRHRDEHIDKVTKFRYHGVLAKLSKIKFPSPAEEASSPSDADEIYRSATKKLIEARRGPQHKVLHDENASYGFRRNLLGLKPIALMIGGIAALATAINWWADLPDPVTTSRAFAALKMSPLLVILFAVDAGYLLLMATIVRPGFVFQAAKEYTDALFKTLDAPGPPKA